MGRQSVRVGLEVSFWLLLLLTVWACVHYAEANYYSCPRCGAAYKQYWYQAGLPGQCRYECGKCGAKLVKCSKAESGWADDAPATLRGH